MTATLTFGELGGVEKSDLGLSSVAILFGGELDREGELTIEALVSSKSTVIQGMHSNHEKNITFESIYFLL